MDRNNTILIMYLSVLVVFITADSVDATYTAIPPTPAIQMINSSGGNVTATTYNDFVELVAGSGMTINMDNTNNEIEFIASSSGLSEIYCTGTDKFKAYNATLNTFICDTDESSGAFPSNVAFTNQTNTFTDDQYFSSDIIIDSDNELFLDNGTDVSIKYDSTDSRVDVTENVRVIKDGAVASVQAVSYGSAAAFTTRSSNGDQATPTNTLSGNVLSNNKADGHTGSSFSVGASFRAVATENWSPTAKGTQWQFKTISNNSTSLTTALTLDQDQNTIFGGDATLSADNELFLDGGTDVSIKYNSTLDEIVPNKRITVQTEAEPSRVRLESYQDNSNPGGNLSLRKARGTIDSPSAVLSGDALGNIQGYGYNGISFVNGPDSRMDATENWDATSRGSKWIFRTVADGTTNRVTAMTLDQDQSTILGGAFTTVRTSTASDVNTVSETIIGITSTASPRTITLDSDHVIDGRIYIIKDESGGAGTNNITIATEGSETIDGSSSVTISSNYGVVRVYSDGTNWFTY